MILRRLFLSLALLLAIASPAIAQNTLVSATITDAGGQAWVSGTYTFTSEAYPSIAIISGTLDSTGSFTSISFPTNNVTAGVGGRWRARICPAVTAPCYGTSISVPGGSTLSLTSVLVPPAITIDALKPPPVTAYTDSEITNSVQGSRYFNVTDNTEHVCKAIPCSSNWQSTPASGASTTFTGDIGIGFLNKQLTVGPPGFRYTTIAAAQASADCPATGCTIYVRSDATLDSSTITITKPIHVVFDCAPYTYSGTGSLFSSTTGVEGVRINGCGRTTQSLTIGTVINITNTSAIGFNMTNSPSLDLEYFLLKGPGSGTGKGVVIGGTRPGMYKILVDSFGSDGITIDGSSTNTNVGTFIHVRSSHNGGHGWVVKGANGNLQNFVSCDASNNIDGFNIASTFNIFVGTDTNSNTANGYHFLTGATNNFGTVYSDASDLMGIRFDAGSAANILTTVDSVTTIADAGSGNRWQGGNQPSANTWNMLEASTYRIWGATSGTNTINAATVSGSSTLNLPNALLTLTADTAAETVSIAIPNTNLRLPQTVALTSQYTNSTTTFTNVAGGNTLQWAVLANTNYVATCHLYYQAAATGGLNIEFTGPASPTSVIYGLTDPITSSTFAGNGVATAYGTSLGAVVGTAATNFDALVSFSLINGGNAGTVNLLAKSSAAVQLQIQAGSYCQVQ